MITHDTLPNIKNKQIVVFCCVLLRLDDEGLWHDIRTLQATVSSTNKSWQQRIGSLSSPRQPVIQTYLLTYSTVQSPSWAADWLAASQEIPRISRNPNVHYRTHKRRPPVPILGQPNPVHMPTSHLLEIHPNIIPPSTPRSTQWSLSLRFPHQEPIHPPLLTHTRQWYRHYMIKRFNSFTHTTLAQVTDILR